MTDDNDDFEIKPAKIPKIEKDSEQSETCVICLDHFTTSGEHRLVSIKCGHIFGKKCILHWLNSKNEECPTCKAHTTKKHIRPVFIDCPSFMLLDNSELVSTTEELQKTKKALREVELERSYLMSQCNSYVIENKKLADLNEKLKTRNYLVENQTNSTQSNSSDSALKFRIIDRLMISKEGDCRVMAYSSIDNILCVSSPSSNPLYAGFGIRTVSVRHSRMMKFIHLHSSMIRDIQFSPIGGSDLMLTGGMDKFVKLTSVKVEKTVSSYMCSAPVWSCCWSNNNYSFFAGLSNGKVEEIDSRKMVDPVTSFWTQAGGPVLSLRFVTANMHMDTPGLIVTNSQKVLHLDTSSRTSSDDSSVTTSLPISTLVAACNYRGSIIHSSFNDRTCHLLSLFRPSADSRSRCLLSQVGTTLLNDVSSLYASDTHSYYGGHRKDFMHRACFVDSGDSANYVVCPDEESCSIKVWDTNTEAEPATLHPKDVSRTTPILDVCQYSRQPLSFAALNSQYLYLYSQ